MTLKRDELSEMTADIPVKFSVKQLIAICGCLVGGTLTVLTFVNSVRQGVEGVQRDVGTLNQRLTTMEQALRDQTQHSREQDEALRQRLADWTPWRWNVTLDIRNLGKAANVEVNTRP